MESFLNDQKKFERVIFKNRTFLNLVDNGLPGALPNPSLKDKKTTTLEKTGNDW